MQNQRIMNGVIFIGNEEEVRNRKCRKDAAK